MKLDKGKITYEQRCSIGDRLRLFRTAKGISQERMAEILEISKTHYGQVERGHSNLGEYRLLLLISNMPDIDLNYIFTGQKRKISFMDLEFECSQEKLFHIEQILIHIKSLLNK